MEMWLLAKRTAVVLSTTLLFAVLVTFVYGSRRILIAFLFAIFFAYLLEPWVLRLQLWPKVSRGSRGLAILTGSTGSFLLRHFSSPFATRLAFRLA